LKTTTDNVYKNTNQKKAFIESDLISGGDPYSSSKAALEIVCEYYKLKFSKTKTILNIARSGNVIGGGDFAKFRLFPDIYRSIKKKRKLIIRSSNSVRPWQHVLEPLYGYIRLVEKTYNKEIKPGSFNFGPGRNQNLSVKNVLLNLKKIYSKIDYKMLTKNNFKESKYLSLDSSLINKKIKYKQVWSINKTINRTIGWYINFLNGKKSYDLCLNDIKEFEKDLLY
jgi:CDP-glucose 4,6-dehydratase